MTNPKILLVEDEESLAEGIQLNLEMENISCIWVARGDEALMRMQLEKFDLVLLDIMLPGMDGLTVCQEMRTQHNLTPVLFLTAKNTENDRFLGFDSGGDDYLGKPFQVRDLLIRIRSILRREIWYQNQSLDRKKYFGSHWIDFDNFTGKGPRGEFQLSVKESMIMKFLMEHSGHAVTRDAIMEKVWGEGAHVTPRTIDNFVVRLRKLIEDDPQRPHWIHTYRSVGYQFGPIPK